MEVNYSLGSCNEHVLERPQCSSAAGLRSGLIWRVHRLLMVSLEGLLSSPLNEVSAVFSPFCFHPQFERRDRGQGSASYCLEILYISTKYIKTLYYGFL